MAVVGRLRVGCAFVLGASSYYFLTEVELLGWVAPPSVARRRGRCHYRFDEAFSFLSLKVGDYLVHVGHGICRFKDLVLLDQLGEVGEVMSLEFGRKAILHLRVQDVHLLSRYVSFGKRKPKLSNLGGRAWAYRRAGARRSSMDLAAQLLSTEAARQMERGFAFRAFPEWERQLADGFSWALTADQQEALEVIFRDMALDRPMDRLLCGDVGFGKTEVALRASFRAVLNHRQVAILVPTTVLCQQHFHTFSERLEVLGVEVGFLSSFASGEERQEVLRALEAGRLDLVVGTHALLSEKVHFARLGLLIIDEEHRFGVGDKETLKKLSSQVDLLSMSATPIPRTLQMALSKAKCLSYLQSAPPNRQGVETCLARWDGALIGQAIERELERKGQVFYLHNRVEGLQARQGRLKKLVAAARVGVVHGKMPRARLAKVMADFIARKIDVLLCTTLIESGIDIPNCNTLIIEDATRLGLSQIHQLRGRVGRSHHKAWCYLLLPPKSSISQRARERLSALERLHQPGSGLAIAMEDLKARGAGNLLGKRQSGHVTAIGFDLYCQLLRQSVDTLRGHKERYLSAQVVVEGPQTPLGPRLPKSYMPQINVRLEYYRQLALANNPARLESLKAELADRFGAPNKAVLALLESHYLRLEAGKKSLRFVQIAPRCLKAKRASGTWVKTKGLFPALTGSSILERLKEARNFLKTLPENP